MSQRTIKIILRLFEGIFALIFYYLIFSSIILAFYYLIEHILFYYVSAFYCAEFYFLIQKYHLFCVFPVGLFLICLIFAYFEVKYEEDEEGNS